MANNSRVDVRNESSRKGIVRRDALERIMARTLAGEGVAHEEPSVSVLLCDDDAMTELNKLYRKIARPTDVLSFESEPIPGVEGPLGDIVIDLELVERRNGGDRAAMRAETRLLFCHGLLHLLGYDHHSPRERRVMVEKQAAYLGITEEAAWLGDAS